MNIKLYICLIALSPLLYGCATKRATSDVVIAPLGIPGQGSYTGPPPQQGYTGYVDKVIGDGSHLLDLPMSRDFIMDSYDKSQAANAKGSKKIFSIKPTGDIKPRAVVLLENKILPSSDWKEQISTINKKKISAINPNVQRKNIDICKGFMKLPSAESMEIYGKQMGDALKSDRKNHVISYMPVIGSNKNNLPERPEDCNRFIKNGYDYANAAEELSFILGDKKLGKSPYLALYESPSSPYSSMVLSLGSLSPESITLLASNWPELIMKVYMHGDSIDPTIGIAVMLSRDPSLQQAQKDAMWKNMKIAVSATTCAVTIIGGGYAATLVPMSPTTFITLGSLIKKPSCKKFVDQASYALGYEKDIPTPS